jgi:aminoglycoside phosphotransferase (APT) family kinase protein
MDPVTYLVEPSEHALRAALRKAAPALAGAAMDLYRLRDNVPLPDRRGSAILDGTYVVKFAWSEPAAQSIVQETRVLRALAARKLPVPRPLVTRRSAALLIYRRIEGVPLTWERACALPAGTARRLSGSLARVMAALHSSTGVVRSVGLRLGPPKPQWDTRRMRRDLVPRLDGRRAVWTEALVRRVEEALVSPGAELVLLHGDLHGWNLVLDPALDRVAGVLDLEEAAIGDHHFDFRYLPTQDATLTLLHLVIREYERETDRRVRLERVMAWHSLTDLGDALWRTEQGVEVVDGPLPRRVDGLRRRLAAAGLDW